PVNGPVDFDAIHELLSAFGDAPIIVKDYVKSQKHYWSEACFIPNASDRAAVERVVRRFLELQGRDLNVGLVFREVLQLKIAGTHPKSGMPLAAEVRTFWARGRCILHHRYWGDLAALDAELPLVELEPAAARVPSSFFAMDVALRDDGEWAIVELGDGQVSGLPSETLAVSFYAALKRSFDHDGA